MLGKNQKAEIERLAAFIRRHHSELHKIYFKVGEYHGRGQYIGRVHILGEPGHDLRLIVQGKDEKGVYTMGKVYIGTYRDPGAARNQAGAAGAYLEAQLVAGGCFCCGEKAVAVQRVGKYFVGVFCSDHQVASDVATLSGKARLK